MKKLLALLLCLTQGFLTLVFAGSREWERQNSYQSQLPQAKPVNIQEVSFRSIPQIDVESRNQTQIKQLQLRLMLRESSLGLGAIPGTKPPEVKQPKLDAKAFSPELNPAKAGLKVPDMPDAGALSAVPKYETSKFQQQQVTLPEQNLPTADYSKLSLRRDISLAPTMMPQSEIRQDIISGLETSRPETRVTVASAGMMRRVVEGIIAPIRHTIGLAMNIAKTIGHLANTLKTAVTTFNPSAIKTAWAGFKASAKNTLNSALAIPKCLAWTPAVNLARTVAANFGMNRKTGPQAQITGIKALTWENQVKRIQEVTKAMESFGQEVSGLAKVSDQAQSYGPKLAEVVRLGNMISGKSEASAAQFNRAKLDKFTQTYQKVEATYQKMESYQQQGDYHTIQSLTEQHQSDITYLKKEAINLRQAIGAYMRFEKVLAAADLKLMSAEEIGGQALSQNIGEIYIVSLSNHPEVSEAEQLRMLQALSQALQQTLEGWALGGYVKEPTIYHYTGQMLSYATPYFTTVAVFRDTSASGYKVFKTGGCEGKLEMALNASMLVFSKPLQPAIARLSSSAVEYVTALKLGNKILTAIDDIGAKSLAKFVDQSGSIALTETSKGFDIIHTFRGNKYKEIILKPGTILERAYKQDITRPISNFTTRGATARRLISIETTIDELGLRGTSHVRPDRVAILEVMRPIKVKVGFIQNGGKRAVQYVVDSKDWGALRHIAERINGLK